ncbi:putative Clp, repeat (R) domain, Clp domain superfamily protein [Helianthus annuus]|nr:putative Clp, repeat (R) domain, Clp domain superfamily protein [Helianthus annuus]
MYIFSPEHPPLTKAAQNAIDWAINEKLKSGETGEVTTSHLLLGIWAQKESAGHKIMAKLGFDDDKAKELAKTVSLKTIVVTSIMSRWQDGEIFCSVGLAWNAKFYIFFSRVKCHFCPCGLGHSASLVQRFYFSPVGRKRFHRCHFSPLC